MRHARNSPGKRASTNAGVANAAIRGKRFVRRGAVGDTVMVFDAGTGLREL